MTLKTGVMMLKLWHPSNAFMYIYTKTDPKHFNASVSSPLLFNYWKCRWIKWWHKIVIVVDKIVYCPKYLHV